MKQETRYGKTWNFTDGSGDSEVEMQDVLYGLVRMLKPNLVVETGCYLGNATRRMAQGIRDNGLGHLITCENHYPNPFKDHEPLYSYIEWREADSLELPELRSADFVFSDSHHHIRPIEYSLVKPGCVFVIHDTDQPYYGEPGFLGEWVKALGGLIFHAGKGFGLLIKK